MKRTQSCLIALVVLSVLSCTVIEIRQSGQVAEAPVYTPLPAPTFTAVQAATPPPTATPIPPTPTLAPTDTPVPPTATSPPEPTDTPVPPTATNPPKPTDTPVPPPQPQEFSGQGKRASSMFQLLPGLVQFHMTHDGTSNFAIWLLDGNGNKVELLVNEIGPFDGSMAFGLPDGGAHLLNVEADGNWHVTASYPDPATAAVMSRLAGHGKQASPMITLNSGLTTFQMNHDGDSNFAIWLYDSEGNRIDLLVNEIGPFDGSTAVGIRNGGAHLLDIEANGNWSVEIDQ